MIFKVFSYLYDSIILVLSLPAKAFSMAAFSQVLLGSKFLVNIYLTGMFIVSPPMPADTMVQRLLSFMMFLYTSNQRTNVPFY